MPDIMILAQEDPGRHAWLLAKSNHKPRKGRRWMFPTCRSSDTSNGAACTAAAPFHKFVLAVDWCTHHGWHHKPVPWAGKQERTGQHRSSFRSSAAARLQLPWGKQEMGPTPAACWAPTPKRGAAGASYGRGSAWTPIYRPTGKEGICESEGMSDLETWTLRRHHFFSVAWS